MTGVSKDFGFIFKHVVTDVGPEYIFESLQNDPGPSWSMEFDEKQFMDIPIPLFISWVIDLQRLTVVLEPCMPLCSVDPDKASLTYNEWFNIEYAYQAQNEEKKPGHVTTWTVDWSLTNPDNK